MSLTVYHADAFTDEPFKGNPAAVCILPSGRSPAWMQNVAMEMNLSETAFLAKRKNGWGLRWFTPKAEVELCGHATLASAHVLWEAKMLNPRQMARFHTASGLLTAVRKGEWIEMDFPREDARGAKAPKGLAKALGATPLYVARNRSSYLAELDSEEVVRQLEPDFALMKTLPLGRVMVTARSKDAKYDFVSRFFAPGVGVNEDPVTGSAHCCLGPYWQGKLGKSELVGYQASARGGIVKVKVGAGRVYLQGKAVTVMKGELIYA
ncbi:MAG: PhzF family phenazine biosynthesis protein [Euryarchaeota archaeon]|nr:PhzF family phenazine biosynthesis protein [Euryarchaeota archaeon]